MHDNRRWAAQSGWWRASNDFDDFDEQWKCDREDLLFAVDANMKYLCRTYDAWRSVAGDCSTCTRSRDYGLLRRSRCALLSAEKQGPGRGRGRDTRMMLPWFESKTYLIGSKIVTTLNRSVQSDWNPGVLTESLLMTNIEFFKKFFHAFNSG